MSDTGNTSTSQAVQTPAIPVQPAASSAAPSTSSSAGYTSSTRIDSLNALRERAPKVYEAMMLGIATTICNKMKASADRLKKMIREASNR